MSWQDKPRDQWTLAEQVEHKRHLGEGLAAWKAQQQQRKEQQVRDQKRSELEAYLSRRAQTWTDSTGTAPSMTVVQTWQREFLDGKQIEAEAERAERLAEAQSQPHYHPYV